MKRAILIVIDSVGIGEMPDAAAFGDAGADTLGHIVEFDPMIEIPHLKSLGLGKIQGLEYLSSSGDIRGSYGRLKELSKGKDTTTGHWEIAGLVLEKPFKTYPHGFPKPVIDAFEKASGRGTLCNQPASGTEVIEAYGQEHLDSGKLIVYTSGDSVFQIAAHEGVVPLEELYAICLKAREILKGDYLVARVIARPFIGEKGSFERTHNRRDFSISPFAPTVLDHLKESGWPVAAVGKIYDIYNGQGITDEIHTKSNDDGMDQTLKMMEKHDTGLIFTNLVDFDSKYGHRRDVAGYRDALEAFDHRLVEIIEALGEEDLLIVTADHGNDPTFTGTDHTREMVPLLITGPRVKKDVDLKTRESFADIAATLAAYFNVKAPENGSSFLNLIWEDRDDQ
ncbi:MAG: phosphopentomutase [delta proteobacterium ML8_F1]|nr:MAG: phosphopentomutase [delta proteobacterium ML8_F1]